MTPMPPTRNPEDFGRITEIFEAARHLAPGKRAAYLSRACQDDDVLRREVEALLEMHDDAEADESFLDAGRALRDALIETEVPDSVDPDAPPPLERPEFPASIGRYQVVDKIAQGGVGAVLKGRDDVIGRDIAIKILLDAHKRNPELVERLTEEAQIGGQLQHPGIVPVYEFGVLGGERPYITMKLVEGRTLSELLAERAHPGEERQHFLGIFEQVCQAMAYAHSRRVIHRDLKPLNLMVGAFGEVQVMDWGLAKVVPRQPAAAPNPAAKTVHTIRSGQSDSASLTGSVMGTPMYMSPEQARGEVEDLDARTDVFSLGAILCEILTGKPPYTGKSITDVVRQASQGDLGDALAGLRASDADPEVVSLAGRCLAPARDARPADARALAREMRGYLESLEERAHEAALEAAAAHARARSERKARILTSAIGVVVTLAVVLGGGGYVWYEQERQARLHRTERLAERSAAEAEQLLSEARAAGPGDITRWEAARVAARGALDHVTGELGEGLGSRTAALAAEIDAGLRAARLIERIATIRAEYDYIDRLEENPAHDRLYAGAFREHLGAHLDRLPLDAAAARLIEGAFPEDMGAALDEWSLVKRRIEGAASDGWKRLLRIARRVDPDPLRTALRAAFEADDREVLEKIADSPDLAERSPLAIGLLARVLTSSRDSARARAVLRAGQAAHPTDFWLTFLLARSLSLEDPEAPEESIGYFRAAIALRPDYPIVYGSLGKAYGSLGRSERAVESIRRGLHLAPDSSMLHMSLGNAFAPSDLDAAEAAHRRAVELAPDDARVAGLAHMNLGVVLFQQDRVDEALPLLERSLELHPDISLSHFYLARIHYQKSELDRAVERLRLALRIGPDNPQAHQMHTYLGMTLFRLGDHGGAVRAFTESLRLEPDDARAHVGLGSALAELGQLERAAESLCAAVRLEAREEVPYLRLYDLLNRGGLGRDAVMEILSLLDGVLHGGGAHHPEARHVYVRAWCEAPEMLYNARVLAAAALDADASGRDAHALGHLGEVQMLVGKTRDALRTFEEGVRSPRAARAMFESLRRCREMLAPDLATYGSVEAALQELGPEATASEARERFSEFLSLERTEDRARRVEFLEGRLLQRQGRHEEAAGRFLELLEADRSAPEPFMALWECLRASKSPEEARALFDTTLGQAPPPAWSFPYAAEAPSGRRPEPQATVSSLSASLDSSAFEHIDPRTRHRASHWQVRRVDGDYARDPLIDLFTDEHLEQLSLPAGLLVTGEALLWRVRHLGADGRFSRFSRESSFTVGGPPLEAVPFDLTPHCRHDVIANRGDREDDAFDQVGYRLVAAPPEGSGFDVQGLPVDGAVGVHRLASYDGPNAIQLARGATQDIRIEIPPARYVALRFLVAGANGGSSLPISLELADGTREDRALPCPDWFDDPLEAAPTPGGPMVTPVWNGMDRVGTRGFEDANDPALFEVVVPVRGAADLRAFVLHPGRASYESDETRFHLFAATGIRG